MPPPPPSSSLFDALVLPLTRSVGFTRRMPRLLHSMDTTMDLLTRHERTKRTSEIFKCFAGIQRISRVPTFFFGEKLAAAQNGAVVVVLNSPAPQLSLPSPSLSLLPSQVVKLVAFRPFTSAADALAQANALSEAAATPELVAFLESALPGAGGDSKDKKKKKSSSYEVGVADPKLGSALGEAAGVKCAANELTSELLRGVRIHAARLLKGLDDADAARARLGLAHAYSRAKVKFNVNRVDNMIIQAIALLDTLDKDVNTFVMRVREW